MAWVLECALDRDLLRAWHACIELFRQLGHEVEGRSTTGSSVIVRSAGERRNDWQSGAGGWTRAKTRELPGTPFGQRMSDDHARTEHNRDGAATAALGVAVSSLAGVWLLR